MEPKNSTGLDARGLRPPGEIRRVTTPRNQTPPPLLPAFASVAVVPAGSGDDEPKWHIATVPSRWEKRLAWHLHDCGVAYFLPMEDVTRVSGGKRERFQRPAFPCYVFFAGDEMAVDHAQRSPHFGSLIRVKDQSQLRADLLRAEAAFGSTLDRLPKVNPADSFRPGRKIVVKAGHPLEGQEGFIDVHTGRGRVVVKITVLGTGTPVEIDPLYLEAA